MVRWRGVIWLHLVSVAATRGVRAALILFLRKRLDYFVDYWSLRLLHPKRILYERYSSHHFVDGFWFLHGFAMGSMAGTQWQKSHLLPCSR
jgi:hypothetical protein